MLKYLVNGEIMKNNWWNDGDSKFKKTLFMFVNWWNDGNNKVLKAFYFSLFIHFVIGLFWLITLGLQYIL